jgi:rhodanese-related sulfurtransferase
VPSYTSAIALSVTGIFVICQPTLAAGDWPDSVDSFITHVSRTIDTTDMDGFLAAVKNPNGALLLDVRDESELTLGHVPGTLNIPRGVLELKIWKTLGYPDKVDTNRKIYVLCRTGRRAILGAKQLQDIGFTNVTAVVMELADWQKQGLPFVNGETK